MIAIALRSMGQRKLRTALTAIAVLLGVAMIAGTYVQTDQIRAAFDDILQTANAGVDANIAPRTAFTQQLRLDPRRSTRAWCGASRACRASIAPPARSSRWARSWSNGRAVAPNYAPAMVIGMVGEPFNPLQLVTGRLPSASGEIVVNRKLAEDEHLDRRAARRRHQPHRHPPRAARRHRRLRQRRLDGRRDDDRRAARPTCRRGTGSRAR